MSSEKPLRDDRRGAVFSDDRVYRYQLRRCWDVTEPIVAFVMLNPSTADAIEDDPTVRRCIGFAKNWGYGALLVGNLFAARTTRPSGSSQVYLLLTKGSGEADWGRESTGFLAEKGLDISKTEWLEQ